MKSSTKTVKYKREIEHREIKYEEVKYKEIQEQRLGTRDASRNHIVRSRHRLFVPDRGGAGTERTERRPGRGVRRTRKPDRFRAARNRDHHDAADDVVRHHLYADFDRALDHELTRDPERLGTIRRESTAAATAESASKEVEGQR